MKVVVQRVKHASVEIEGNIVGKIDKGLLLFVGFHQFDTLDMVRYLAKKIVKLRIFSDSDGKLNLNIHQASGKILSVSQFTLYGDTRDGNRPSFTEALAPDQATKFYDIFNQELESAFGQAIEKGVFGADMLVTLANDGPLTILLEK